MDVHRVRFVPYPTTPVTALAFSRSSDRGYTVLPALKLALGRADGTIEIWNPQDGAWLQETVFLGEPRSIDGLAWTQEPDEKDAAGKTLPGQQRLFSISSSPSVTEWDLLRGIPKQKSTGNFSDIWSFAVQPRASNHSADSEHEANYQDIAAGCGDGSIALISTAGGDLQFKRFMARVSSKKARCMCIIYQNWNVVAAGFQDSLIRIYDTRSGNLLRTMSFGSGIPGAPKNVMIWKLISLNNGDLVSGDSNGEVRVWDGSTYSLRQRLNAHDTDCLDLSASHDGKTLVSASIEGKMAVFRLSQPTGGKRAWARIGGRKLHNGEFKAMASYDSSRLSVAVFGGSNASPIVVPLREYGKENPRALPGLPSNPPVISAPKSRLLVSWWGKDVYMWRIAKPVDVGAGNASRKLVARISMTDFEDIRSVSISDDGKVLAASSGSGIRVFQLRHSTNGEGPSVRKVPLPKDFEQLGSRLVEVSPDANWLVAVTLDSEVHVARLDTEPTKPKLIRVLDKTVELDRRRGKGHISSAFRQYDRTIAKLAFNSRSSILVASDQSGNIDSWILQGHQDVTAPAIDTSTTKVEAADDSESDSSDDNDDEDVVFYGQQWVDNPLAELLPRLDSAVVVLTFRPDQAQTEVNGNPGVHATRHNPHAHSHDYAGGQGRVWILTAKHQMVELDVLAGKVSDWGRRNPSAALPKDFRKILDRAMGAFWDTTAREERLWIYGSSWMFMLDVGCDLHNLDFPLKKRKRKLKEADYENKHSKRVKNLSGAGGLVNAESQTGLSERIKRRDGSERRELDVNSDSRAEMAVDSDAQMEDGGPDDDEDDDEGGADVRALRLQSNGVEAGETALGAQKERWWSTFRYRPILGVALLQNEDDQIGDETGGVEVVVVERPNQGG